MSTKGNKLLCLELGRVPLGLSKAWLAESTERGRLVYLAVTEMLLPSSVQDCRRKLGALSELAPPPHVELLFAPLSSPDRRQKRKDAEEKRQEKRSLTVRAFLYVRYPFLWTALQLREVAFARLDCLDKLLR
jgi:hypothetical protein